MIWAHGPLDAPRQLCTCCLDLCVVPRSTYGRLVVHRAHAKRSRTKPKQTVQGYVTIATPIQRIECADCASHCLEALLFSPGLTLEVGCLPRVYTQLHASCEDWRGSGQNTRTREELDLSTLVPQRGIPCQQKRRTLDRPTC